LIQEDHVDAVEQPQVLDGFEQPKPLFGLPASRLHGQVDVGFGTVRARCAGPVDPGSAQAGLVCEGLTQSRGA
jgi:hypothetical protein